MAGICRAKTFAARRWQSEKGRTVVDAEVGVARADGPRMPLVECLRVLRAVRGEAVVISCMGNSREWQSISDHPLDFHYVPSSMGQASSLGLGLALALPQTRVIVLNGDGSTLMNLGSLVTIGARGPANLTLIVVDNGVYEVTGGQPHCGAAPARADGKDLAFDAIARVAGFVNAYRFEKLSDWSDRAAEVVASTGPTFVLWRVWPIRENFAPRSPGNGPARAAAFRRELAARRTTERAGGP
ncbi:MAG: thiamine pyrophosphate-binding protein [Planctomycetota bacterium]|nr:MAG: thiamine pyrophosphate-binding protein [Planctomycetota bacterium]